MSLTLGERLAKQGDAIDSRYHPSAAVRRGILNKVFPTHWSFLLGEIALYSFIILLITGVFLTIWFSYKLTKGTKVVKYSEMEFPKYVETKSNDK